MRTGVGMLANLAAALSVLRVRASWMAPRLHAAMSAVSSNVGKVMGPARQVPWRASRPRSLPRRPSRLATVRGPHVV